MNKIGVMHVVDTLAAGGAERTAVNLANHLPGERFNVWLCTTREDGPLANLVEAGVGRLRLERRSRFDAGAIKRLVDFIRTNDIRILHAHGASLFCASVAAAFRPHPHVVWHLHYGRYALEDRSAWHYRLAVSRAAGVITVNQQLAEWVRRRLRAPERRVWYIPNPVCVPQAGTSAGTLPGEPGTRIVCVANLRPEKDHVTLVRAMASVICEAPDAHLLLVGASQNSAYLANADYFEAVRSEISRHGMERNVSFLGQRSDVAAVLRECAIGVLSSKTEGLPVSLLEYGMAGLPVVATDVGECAHVLNAGRAGLVVPPSSPERLAVALLELIRSPERRLLYGDRFRRRVQKLYSPARIVGQVCQVYDKIIRGEKAKTRRAGARSTPGSRLKTLEAESLEKLHSSRSSHERQPTINLYRQVGQGAPK